MAVNGQILAGGSKGFQHRFQFATPPKAEVLSIKVYNINTFGELIEKNKILAFGSYDLIVCYKGQQTSYEVKKTSKDFCEIITLKSEHEKLNDETEIQVMTYFSREPKTKFYVVMGLDASIKGIIQNLSGTPHKIVVEVNGEIYGEIKNNVEKENNQSIKELPVEKESRKIDIADKSSESLQEQDIADRPDKLSQEKTKVSVSRHKENVTLQKPRTLIKNQVTEFKTDKKLMEAINSPIKDIQYKDIKGVKVVDSSQKTLKQKTRSSDQKSQSINMTEDEYNKMLAKLKKRYSGG